MRVLHIVPDYPDPDTGGYSGIQYRGIVRAETAAGISCCVLAGRYLAASSETQEDGAATVHRFDFGENATQTGWSMSRPARAWRHVRAGLRAFDQLHGDQPFDLVHAHQPLPCGLHAVLAARRARLPVVVSLHGSDMLVYPHRRFGAKPLLRWILRHAHAVIAVSEPLADAARLLVPRLTPYVIPMGIDDGLFHPGLAAAERTQTVVSTRTLAPIYRVDTLVTAATEFASRESVEVQVYGDGPARAQLERMATGSTVTFHGAAPPRDLAAALRTAAIYVSTSESDGTSVSLLEALACGAYPVVTDIPANRPWITDGVNGRLVPVGDAAALASAIVDALGAVDARERARVLNAELARDVSWTAVAERLKALYQDVLAGNAN